VDGTRPAVARVVLPPYYSGAPAPSTLGARTEAPTTVPLYASVDGGQTWTVAGPSFTYINSPTVAEVYPRAARVGASVSLVLLGAGFSPSPGLAVRFVRVHDAAVIATAPAVVAAPHRLLAYVPAFGGDASGGGELDIELSADGVEWERVGGSTF